VAFFLKRKLIENRIKTSLCAQNRTEQILRCSLTFLQDEPDSRVHHFSPPTLSLTALAAMWQVRLWVATCLATVCGAAKSPHILFIVSDDLGCVHTQQLRSANSLDHAHNHFPIAFSTLQHLLARVATRCMEQNLRHMACGSWCALFMARARKEGI
jgi:hypothetical protein